MANLFYQDGKLDRKYLRVCAVYKLLDRRRIGTERACELLKGHTTCAPMRVVEIWTGQRGPLSDRGRANRAAWRA